MSFPLSLCVFHISHSYVDRSVEKLQWKGKNKLGKQHTVQTSISPGLRTPSLELRCTVGMHGCAAPVDVRHMSTAS